MEIIKRISRAEAVKNYGINATSGAGFFLTDTGAIIDSLGGVRYLPSTTGGKGPTTWGEYLAEAERLARREMEKSTVYRKGKAQAIATAQEWQQESSTTAQSWSEIYKAQQHFLKLAKRYGLIKEFKGNGII